MLWVSLPKRLRNYRLLPKFIGIWQNVPLAALRKFWMHAAYNITTTTRRCNHIFTLDFAEMNIKALLYTQTDCTKIVTTTSTIQLNNWHYINLFSNGNLWSRHETSSKLWHRPIQSRTTKTQSLTVTLFDCANVVATASVGSRLRRERPDVRRTANTLCLGRGGPKLSHDICAVIQSDGQWTSCCWLTLYRPMQNVM